VTARTLRIAKDTVTDALRSIEGLLWYVNYDYLNRHQNGGMTVELVLVNEVEKKIERKHLSLRIWCSRLVRKGIRFSKDHRMHKIVIALVINYWFFQRIIW
jgi:hypothetical protein